ncbi:DUF962 domain-containing protein [Balamuthia mandrillaris]
MQSQQQQRQVIVRPPFHSFAEFFPFYMKEHSDRTNRRLHFVGTTLAMAVLLVVLLTGNYQLLFLPLLCGYGFAWVGHFFFEKNKPATFKHPLYSLRGDFHMWWHIVTGRLPF